MLLSIDSFCESANLLKFSASAAFTKKTSQTI